MATYISLLSTDGPGKQDSSVKLIILAEWAIVQFNYLCSFVFPNFRNEGILK